MIYIVLKDNKIIHVCETNSESNVKKSLAYESITEFDQIKPIPNEYFMGKVGNDIREFDVNFEFLPLFQRKDYVEIPEGKKIEDNEFVDMSIKEKIDTGLSKLSDREKYDDIIEQVRPKTVDELLADKIITATEWHDTKLAECLNERKSAYQSESDPLKNELEFDGEDLTVWRDKVTEIKQRYPKPIK